MSKSFGYLLMATCIIIVMVGGIMLFNAAYDAGPKCDKMFLPPKGQLDLTVFGAGNGANKYYIVSLEDGKTYAIYTGMASFEYDLFDPSKPEHLVGCVYSNGVIRSGTLHLRPEHNYLKLAVK